MIIDGCKLASLDTAEPLHFEKNRKCSVTFA